MEANKKRKRIYWIVGIVVVLGAIGAFFFMRSNQAQQTEAAENAEETVTGRQKSRSKEVCLGLQGRADHPDKRDDGDEGKDSEETVDQHASP